MVDTATFAAFGNGVFQVGYVTADLERAMHALRTIHGVHEFLSFSAELEVRGANGVRAQLLIDVAHSLVGGTHIEVIEPRPGCIALYEDYVPRKAQAPILRQHHLAMLVPEGAWTNFRSSLDDRHLPVVMENAPEYPIQFCYVDDRDTSGHYLEYVADGSAWRTFAATMPGWKGAIG
jgi:hypothetical protein